MQDAISRDFKRKVSLLSLSSIIVIVLSAATINCCPPDCRFIFENKNRAINFIASLTFALSCFKL